MGWGTGQWGQSPWGLGTIFSANHIVNAYAIANRTVRVTLAATPLAKDNTIVGDALDPNTWTVRNVDEDEDLTVLTVGQYNATTFDLSLLKELGSIFETQEVDATLLLDSGGLPLGPPQTFEFPGLLADTDEDDTTRQAARQLTSTDIANPPFADSTGANGGTLVINAGGDYRNVTGPDLVKKLIIRRLTTTKGAFFHLPDYGMGFRPKWVFYPSQLLTLQKEIADQVALEREVESATATVTILSGTSVSVTVNAKLRNYQDPISVTLTAPIGF